MQHIQDKAFDRLFKDKLEGLEIEPDEGLWNNIAAELQSAPKRSIPVYWMAAALAALVTAASLLIPETETIRLQGRKDSAPISAVIESPKSFIGKISGDTTVVYKSTPLILPPRYKPEPEYMPEVNPVEVRVVNEHLVDKPFGEEIISVPKQEVSIQQEVILASHILKDADDSNLELNNTEAATGKSIKNVGDLINFVVNKVDKREKKFIQFDTDDDNSSIVALNIGFIKLNRKSDK